MGCIANRGAWGCQEARRRSLAAATGVAISPDGANVYVAASFNIEDPRVGGNSVTTFARAPDGSLVDQACIANPPDAISPGLPHGCETAPQASLRGAEGVVVSPDGTNVYVTSRGGGPGRPAAITEFARGPGGVISPLGCIAADTSTGCSPFPHLGVSGQSTITSIAISPDGTDVYVAASESSAAGGFAGSTMARFSRAPDGALSEVGCLSTIAASGCALVPEGWGFGSLAISPDGGDVYALGYQRVEWLSIGAGGPPTPRGCIAERGGPAHECTAGSAALGFLTDLAVAPDGAAVYAGSSGTLVRLARALDGSLTETGCLSYRPKGGEVIRGCGATPGNNAGARSIAMSPEGRVYTDHSGTLAAFGRTADGRLVERGCVANTGPRGQLLSPRCVPTLHASLRGAEGIAVSPNGRDVYVASITGIGISWFKRPPPR